MFFLVHIQHETVSDHRVLTWGEDVEDAIERIKDRWPEVIVMAVHPTEIQTVLPGDSLDTLDYEEEGNGE